MQEQVYGPQDRDSLLERQLDEGEELLWFDRPTTNRRNNSPQRRALIILSIIYGTIGAIFLFAAFKLFIGGDQSDQTGTLICFIVGSIFLLIPMISSIVLIVSRRRISPEDTLYAITNQRIIIIYKGRTITTVSYGRTDLGPITCIEQPDGSGDLIFAGIEPQYGHTTYSSGQYGAGNSSSYNNNRHPAGRFIGIHRVREAEQLLRKIFK